MSIGLKFTYGPFGLYTAGDFEDRVPQPDGSRFEIEDAMAEAVGRTAIAKMDHHGISLLFKNLLNTAFWIMILCGNWSIARRHIQNTYMSNMEDLLPPIVSPLAIPLSCLTA
jgi:hypothetical protein